MGDLGSTPPSVTSLGFQLWRLSQEAPSPYANAQGSRHKIESCGEKKKQAFHSGHCRQGFGLIPGSFSACTGCSPISMIKFEMLGLELESGPKLSIHFLDSTSNAQVPKSMLSAPQICASVVPCKTGLGPVIKGLCSKGIQRMSAGVSWKFQNPWAEWWWSLPERHLHPKY